MKFSKKNYLLIAILSIAFLLRVINYNWDGPYSFQPDERMIGLVTEKLNWNKENLFLPTSSMNPEFFAYGSFPIYLLWVTKEIFVAFSGQELIFDDILNLGRVISALSDTLSVLVIFLLAKKISTRNKNYIAFFSAGVYAILALPIQLSHYYAVDTLLNLGLWTSLYLSIVYQNKKSNFRFLFLGAVIGMTVATKITGLILIIPIVIYLLFTIRGNLISKVTGIIFFLLSGLMIFIILMPYALIDWENFYEQINQQSKLFYDAYAYPYTLQYVGTLPYLYFIKNIVIWGAGVVVSLLSGLGILIFLKKRIRSKFKLNLDLCLITMFVVIYFVYMGYSEVKFNRYMLPIYPAIALIAGYGTSQLVNQLSKKIILPVTIIIFVSLTIYPSAFISTYFQTDTRSKASEWINENVPPGSTIAIEHWDDRIPVDNLVEYNFVELKIYDQPDDQIKWNEINRSLKNSDYIVLASNRLYGPVQKLDNCNRYEACYPIASKYYKSLFSNDMGFKKVAEFENPIKIPFTNIKINDKSADESFTVYERPKVIIFKKNE